MKFIVEYKMVESTSVTVVTCWVDLLAFLNRITRSSNWVDTEKLLADIILGKDEMTYRGCNIRVINDIESPSDINTCKGTTS